MDVLNRLNPAALPPPNDIHRGPVGQGEKPSARIPHPGKSPALVHDPDENLLEDAVSNVVQNAVKFTPHGGRIVVRIDVSPDSAAVVVMDSGPGIQPGERGLIFHSGVRGSAGSSVEGTGHGLALVADTLDRHGGHLELDSAPGGGALVRLVLPIGAGPTGDVC